MNKDLKSEDLKIKFLPSNHGNGFIAIIKKEISYKSEDWNGNYKHIKGLAIDFEPKTNWEKIVKFRLMNQGVKFIPE